MKKINIIILLLFLSLVNQEIFAFGDEPVLWKKQKLSWSDFRGKPPRNPKGSSVAETSTTISLEPVDHQGEKVLVEIKAVFNPGDSWVLPGNKNAHVLNHEQRHFDLTEYCVRRIRKELKDINNYLEVFDRITGDCEKMQKHYDRDTDHGINSEKQKEWDRKIDRLLESLDRYSGTRVLLDQ